MNDSVPDTLRTAWETSELVEGFLRDYFSSVLQGQDELMRACERSMAEIGLRIRPFLLRISCHQGGLAFEKIIHVSAGIELVQLSTLVIDDILDESSLRNRKLSIVAEHGWKACLSIGTVMYSLGFCLISEGIEKNHHVKNGIAVVKLFSRTHADIYIGQFLDLRFERDTAVTEGQYLDMISRTTARFIQTPLVAGAMLWNAPTAVIKALEGAGLALGMAFQIRDDVIDVIGETECTGKPVGGDIRRCKMRLPLIQALQVLNGDKHRRLLDIMQNESVSDQALSEAIGLITESGSIEYCIYKTKEYCKIATDTISQLPREFTDLKDHFCVVAVWISSFEDGTS